MNIGQYVEKYRKIRKGNGDFVLLEGIHAFKHAFRFEAKFEEILIADENLINSFKENVLRKDEKDFLLKNSIKVEKDFFEQLLPYTVRSKVLAIAKKPVYKISDINSDKPIIFLENPANPENVGMVMRAVAAWKKNDLEVGALVVSGIINPFSASVLRAAAGLCFALPIFQLKEPNYSTLSEFTKNRIIISMDAQGKNLNDTSLAKNSFIIFGTEREGVSPELKKISNEIVGLEMRNNVSSLNLATSVSAFLYGAKFK